MWSETGRRGHLLILSGPAGSGKTTLIEAVHEQNPQVIKNISYTTREPRHGEVDGRDYFFVSPQEFTQRLEQGEFLEHIHLFGHSYGTSKKFVESMRVQGYHVVLVIDIEGACKLRKELEVTTVFLLPPDLKTLQNRLANRGSESVASIQARLQRAEFEIQKASEYDYCIVNEDLMQARQEFEQIIMKINT